MTFISSTATKSSSGVVTYLVRVEITDDQGAQIKEGMTTYVEFLTQEAVDAILVPVEAVTNRGRTSTVTLADGKEREVIVGVSDGTMIEIISGLSIDENILVGGSPLSIEKRPERTLSTEMLEKMKEGGFTDQEIEKAKSGEMTNGNERKNESIKPEDLELQEFLEWVVDENDKFYMTKNTTESVIQMQGVKKSYWLSNGVGVPVLHGIDLDIKKGEFVALMGESGGGKSTLMNIIGFLHPLDEGIYFS